MASFYPHKQTLLIAVVCVLIVGTAAYAAFKGSLTGQQLPATTGIAIKTSSQEPITTNSDWQKQFFSTSTSAFKANAAVQSGTSPANEPLTPTDIFGEAFFSRYMQMRQAGLTDDPDTVNQVGGQIISDSIAQIQTPQPFPLSSIHVVTAVDQASLQKYGSSVSAILSSYIPDQDHNEATIAEQALEKGNMDSLSDIDPIISNYQKALASLKAMPVPKPLASYHLDLMNGVAVSLFNAQALRHVDKDPMSAMAAIGMEIQGLQFISDAVTEIQQYLTANGIAFQ